MDSEILHQGTVTAVDGDRLAIRLGVSAEECGRCAISHFCGKPRTVAATMSGAGPELVGKTVKVAARPKVRLVAQAMLVVIPLVLMVMAVIACALFGLGDLATSIACLGVLVGWFVFLYVNRGKLNRETAFSIVAD